MVAHRAGQQTCTRGVSEPLTAALKNKQRQIGDLETYEFPWGAAFHDDSPIWRAAPLSRERSLPMSFIVLDIFSGEHAALAAAGVPLLLRGLLLPSWRSTNRTSCSGRFGAVASDLGWAGGGLRYLETGLSVSAHRSCSCSSTWGLPGAHSACHAAEVTGYSSHCGCRLCSHE